MQLVLHGQTGVSFASLKSLRIEVDAEALARKEEAVAAAREIELVNNAFLGELAVQQLRSLKSLLEQAESLRVELKAPVLELGRKLDTAAKGYKKELAEEYERLHQLVNDYTEGLVNASKLAEDTRNAALEALERRRIELAQEKACCSKLSRMVEIEAELEAIHQKQTELLSAPSLPVKAEGTKIKMRWAYDVADLNELARCRPDLCNIEASHSKIMAEIKAGARSIPGLANIREIPDVKI